MVDIEKLSYTHPPDTVESIYGQRPDAIKKVLDAKGYEATAFRPVKPGDTYFGVGEEISLLHFGSLCEQPRLIVRPKPKPKRLVLQQTDKVTKMMYSLNTKEVFTPSDCIPDRSIKMSPTCFYVEIVEEIN